MHTTRLFVFHKGFSVNLSSRFLCLEHGSIVRPSHELVFSPLENIIPGFTGSIFKHINLGWVTDELLTSVGNDKGADAPDHKTLNIEHILTSIARKEGSETIKDGILVGPVVGEDPEVDTEMVNNEPHDDSEDGGTNLITKWEVRVKNITYQED